MISFQVLRALGWLRGVSLNFSGPSTESFCGCRTHRQDIEVLSAPTVAAPWGFWLPCLKDPISQPRYRTHGLPTKEVLFD